MKLAVIILGLIAGLGSTLTFDFGTDCAECEDWFVVLDGVMGGRSTGVLEKKTNSYVLSGTISLENNGGFASIRTSYRDYDLSGYTAIRIRYRSMGQDFGFTLNKYRQFWLPNYKVNLPVSNGKWVEKRFELKDFDTYRLGRKTGGNPDIEDLSNIIRLGFISNTKAATVYSFEVDTVIFE